MAHTIAVISGKGGVGKSTVCASLGLGLALSGHKTAVIDFDIGLRNLDLATGSERRILYDFIHVLEGEAPLGDALIRNRHCDNLYLLAASQTRDKSALTESGVGQVLQQLADAGFEYVLCDAPPGMESAARLTCQFADRVIVCVTPDTASVRATDRILGLLQSRSIADQRQQLQQLLINRIDKKHLDAGTALATASIIDTLAIDLLAEVPACSLVARAWHEGKPVIADTDSLAGAALRQAVSALTGKPIETAADDSKTNGLIGRLIRR
jgi:septum site-determining protein MinD